MKKKRKGIVAVVIVIAVLLLAVVGYNLYRYPARFHSQTDLSLDEAGTEQLRAEIAAMEDQKVLVAYFSYSGNTRAVAQSLAELTHGDLFEISPREDYSNVYTQSNSEIRRRSRPELDAAVEDMGSYDIVFVGYPVWWHATPAPVNSFLESYDLTGKLVIPFCTSGGSDISETMPTFLGYCEGAAVYGGRRITNASQLEGWLTDLNLGLI